MTTPVTAEQTWIERLRNRLAGRVIVPGDPDYEHARMVVDGRIDKRPAAIARVANAQDVASVIRLTRETGVELAVRSGGHDGAGHSTVDGGLVLDVRDLKR